MYPVSTPEIIILDRVRQCPKATARLERLLPCIEADRVTEVDDAGLEALFIERGWTDPAMRTGQHRMARHPAIIFNTFRWLTPEAHADLAAKHPALARHLLLGHDPWTLRDHRVLRRDMGCVCQSAWEIHCAYGCLHACDYCHVAPYLNVMLNLEELAERVRDFGESLPEQRLYKFDNFTDTICLEPEYGASRVMVEAFADWPGRYLLLYTKSDNVEHLLDLDHRGHTLVSWSLSSATVASEIEKGTPSNAARIEAMARCEAAGYRTRVRISPICPVRNWREEYAETIRLLLERARPEVISIDVVGWMTARQMFDALDTNLFEAPYAAEIERLAHDGIATNEKHLFPHAMRAEILRFMIETIQQKRPGVPVSLCVETEEMWRELGPLLGMTPGRYVCCCGPDSVPGHAML